MRVGKVNIHGPNSCLAKSKIRQVITRIGKHGANAFRISVDMEITHAQNEPETLLERLAIDGGNPTVTAPGPVSWMHGSAELGEEEIAAVTAVLRTKNLFRFLKDRKNSAVAQFEDLFAEKSGARHVLAVNSGTSALIAGMVGIGVSAEDEVLVPAYTYIATAAAVLALGAIPVIVEIDDSFTMDPADMEKKITPRTKAIVPVHMRGLPCNMSKIMEIAKRRNLTVMEDCAQANGGTYKGNALGTLGDVGAYSMQHFKIITAGEGGVVVTNNKSVFDRAAIYHDSAYTFWMEGKAKGDGGSVEEVEHWRHLGFLGENYRQSELHGAVALEQLKKREHILERTREAKKRMREVCAKIPGAILETSHDSEGDCGISLAVLLEDSEQAVRLADVLGAEGVQCGGRISKQIPNRHVFWHWDYVIEKRTPHLSGFPWKKPDGTTRGEYVKEMCPTTISLLERALVFPICQAVTGNYLDQVCKAICKVARNW